MHCALLSLVALGFGARSTSVFFAARPPCLQRVEQGAAMCVSPDSMTYRQLQQACKKRGLGARGKTEDLRERLRTALQADVEGQARTRGSDLAVGNVAAPRPNQLDPSGSNRREDGSLRGLVPELGPNGDGGGAMTQSSQSSFVESEDDDDLLAELLRDLDDSGTVPRGAAPNSANVRQSPTAFEDDQEALLSDTSLADALSALDRLDAVPRDGLLEAVDSGARVEADEAADLDKFACLPISHDMSGPPPGRR